MKLVRVRYTSYRVPFRTPYATSKGAATHRDGVLVELTTDDGIAGLGEACADPNEAPIDALMAAPALAAMSLPGRDIDDVRDLDFRARCAALGPALACALDTAVCDILAQSHQVPLSRHLVAGASPEVPVNALVTAPDLIRASRDAAAAREAGYRCVKLKVGMEDELAGELARVVAVRRAIGPDVKLRLDPNGAWDIATATRVLRAVAPLDIEYVEQPLPPGNLDAMARLQNMVEVPIAADEDVTDVEGAHRIFARRAATVLVLKPQRLGGVRPCLQVIDEARRAGLRCVVTTNIDTGIGIAACLHLAAVLPVGSPACGLSTASLLEHDLTPAPIPVVDGVMRVPPRPGLGVTLDEAALAHYTDGWHEAGA